MAEDVTRTRAPREPSSRHGPDHAPLVPHRPGEIEAALERLGLAPSRRLGQSFLTDPFVADAEAALAVPSPGGRVLEIGGGLGILTEALLRRHPASLAVIEKDPRLADHLRATFGGSISVRREDALAGDLLGADVVVGNLPFSTGTPILERVWTTGVPRFVGMLQREVVDRVVAPPGGRSYGRLTILAAYFGETEPFQTVPPTAFHPVPAVEGRVFRFLRRSVPRESPTRASLERVLDAVFSSRRKQLRNLLPRLLSRGEDPLRVAGAAGWPTDWPRQRPENLAPEAYFRLAEVLDRGASGVPSSRPARQA